MKLGNLAVKNAQTDITNLIWAKLHVKCVRLGVTVAVIAPVNVMEDSLLVIKDSLTTKKGKAP